VAIATRRGSSPVRLRRGDRLVACDLLHPGAGRALVDLQEPEIVLHLAALSSLSACEERKDLARRVNVDASRELAAAAAACGAYFVLFSTDQVFDGESAPYAEEAPPRPLSAYGRSKAEAEQAVLEAHPDALVLRVSLVLGPGRTGALDMLRPREGAAPVRLFVDEWRSPLSVLCLGRILEALLRDRPAGILHLGGADRVHRLELGQRIVQAFGWSTELVAGSRTEVAYPRPRDLTLATRRLEAEGWPGPLPLPGALEELRAFCAGDPWSRRG
jgi:dTDP-4-dehydrorhamnose reductase